jgi:SAM-dependent methyltransferase
MSQTEKSFSDKWHRNRDLAFSETLREGSEIQQWILRRNGWDGPDGLRAHLSERRRILDAGCGNGRVTSLLHRHAHSEATVTGIDLTAADVARENLAGAERTEFFTRDLLGDLADLGRFDFIYCQEVLHHTADPRRAFLNLSGLLAPGGELAIYVYRVKAPTREFTDDFVRSAISGMPYEEAMAVCRQITALGMALHDSGHVVRVPEVPVLGISAGEYPVQRLLYHFFLKCYWNDALSFEDNAVINYDWFHPQLATRHTMPEVLGWFQEAGLRVEHRSEDEYGITVRGIAVG